MTPHAEALRRALGRPEAFAPHDAPFWDDPHIGTQMLAAHLDPQTDAASRRPVTILRTVEHLCAALGLAAGTRLLDLGCGPGLYAAEFVKRGLVVTGMELSPVAVGHARGTAEHAGLMIEYRVGDYTVDALGGPYDAAVLIYLDFGVPDDAGRDRLLDALHASLAVGAPFAFDVHARARERVDDARISVSSRGPGFWRPHPHLELQTTYRYDRDLDLTQHAIVDPDGKITTYRIWDRAYTVGELRRLLARHGFVVDQVWSDLTGMPWQRSSPTLAITARRR